MKTPTPYDQLVAVLVSEGAQRLAVVDGPNGPKSDMPMSTWSELEFWVVPANASNAPPTLKVVQRWLESGGFDAFTPIKSHVTVEAIAEVVGKYLPHLKHKPIGCGCCPVCGHHGEDCTGRES